MDLTPSLLRELDDVTTLYERKLCSLGVVQLKVSRAAQAFRLDKPDWSDSLNALAHRIGEADARKVEWMEGMALMDQIRKWVKNPPAAERPTLELVAPEPTPVPPPEEDIPEDATEPATPRNIPVRTL